MVLRLVCAARKFEITTTAIPALMSATLAPTDTTINTSATSDIVGYRLRRAQLSVFSRFTEAFADLNLRPAEYSVLALIEDNPGRKQSEIAEVLGIKRANFVALVNGLEQRGLIERLPVHGDRRANALHLTPEGARFLGDARAIQDAFESDCVRRLGGTQEREALLRLLERLS